MQRPTIDMFLNTTGTFQITSQNFWCVLLWTAVLRVRDPTCKDSSQSTPANCTSWQAAIQKGWCGDSEIQSGPEIKAPDIWGSQVRFSYNMQSRAGVKLLSPAPRACLCSLHTSTLCIYVTCPLKTNRRIVESLCAFWFTDVNRTLDKCTFSRFSFNHWCSRPVCCRLLLQRQHKKNMLMNKHVM